jgi:hypothetical protein
MLNDVVNKLERGDIVLMKTLVRLNYQERMICKEKYEDSYETDLKKGLVKVMEKQYEPLINALLTDMDEYETCRICESLYHPNDAAVVITDLFISRNLEQKNSLLIYYHQKMDSELKNDIATKIDGHLQVFLLALLKNNNLDNDTCDKNMATNDAKRQCVSFCDLFIII